MDKDRVWVLVERGSYIVTLFASLIEVCEFIASCLF